MLPNVIQNLRVQNRKTYDVVLCEWRLMFATTLACCVALLVFLVATFTDHWVVAIIEGAVVQLPVAPSGGDLDHPDPRHPTTENLTTVLHVGIWREHRLRHYENGTRTEEWIPHFPAPPNTVRRLYGHALPHYYRSQAVFSSIATVLMLSAIVCAMYSFQHYRYMYKRLTAGIQALAGEKAERPFTYFSYGSQVTVHHLNEWRLDLMSVRQLELQRPIEDGSNDATLPNKELSVTLTHKKYGYSTYLAWYAFATHIVAPVIFVIGSRKRKGAKAATEEFEYEDRTIVIGR